MSKRTSLVDVGYASGTLASRPTAASFGVGFYFATDDEGGMLYRSNGSTWTKIAPGVGELSGKVLARASSTSTTNVTNGTPETDLANIGTLTVPVTTRAWSFYVFLEAVHSVAGNVGNLFICKSDNTVVVQWQFTLTTTTEVKPVSLEYPMDALATETTYKLRAHRGASGTLTIVGGTQNPKWGWYARLD